MALKLSMTCGPYDRCRALIDGTVKPEGIDLSITVNGDDGARQGQVMDGVFDIAECYAGRYIADLSHRTMGFTAIPIFVKRMFRHSYIYVNKHSGIRTPKDLHGKRVGLQNWATTAAIWARGILVDEYGVDLAAINWVPWLEVDVAGWQQPSWLKLDFAPKGTTPRELLAAGKIDACISTEMLAPDEHPDVEFLFPDYPALERDWYRRTGFFPIMHVLLIRDSVLKESPWVAMSVFKAWEESKQHCYRWLEWQRIHQSSMWFRALWEEERKLGGPAPYRWGFKGTRAEVDKLLEYSHRDGMTTKLHKAEDMFHPSTLAT